LENKNFGGVAMKKNMLVVCGMVLFIGLQSCAVPLVAPLIAGGIGGGHLISGQEKAADQATLQLDKALLPSAFVDGAMLVGKNLGFEANDVDRRNGRVMFSGGTNRFESAFLGKSAHQTIRVSLQNGGKEIDINIDAMGNFGQGNQEAVTKMLSDFKEGLAKQFGVSNLATQ